MKTQKSITDLEKIAEELDLGPTYKDRGKEYHFYELRKKPLELIKKTEEKDCVQHITILNQENLSEILARKYGTCIFNCSEIKMSLEQYVEGNKTKKEISIFVNGHIATNKEIETRDLEHISSAGYEITYLGSLKDHGFNKLMMW